MDRTSPLASGQYGKPFSTPSYNAVGDPFPHSNKDKYPLARGKQFETPFPASQRTVVDGTINPTSYNAVGDPYEKPRPKQHGEMAGLSQMSGSSAARTVENTINSTTYTTVGDPYPQSNKDKYPLARGKQFGTGTAQASGTIDGAIGTMSQSHITIGTPYIQGGHSPAKESGLYERCAGKQFETVGPKYGSPGQGATDALIKPLGFVTVGDPYDDRLRSMPWKGSQDYTRNIQCERLREQLKKDRRTAGRPLQFEFVAAQGLPTLSLRRESSGARRLSAEQSFEAERERSKLLQKFPRYAKALSPDRLKPRPTPYIGPDAGPQLLGRKGPNSDENPLPYSPTLSPSPEALRTAKRLSGLPG